MLTAKRKNGLMEMTDSAWVSSSGQGRLVCAPKETHRITRSLLSFDGDKGDSVIDLVTWGRGRGSLGLTREHKDSAVTQHHIARGTNSAVSCWPPSQPLILFSLGMVGSIWGHFRCGHVTKRSCSWKQLSGDHQGGPSSC